MTTYKHDLDLYTQWLEGHAGPHEVLRQLAMDLGEVESELAPLEAERQTLRSRMSEVVDRIGGKAEVPGFGKLEITSATKTASYDRKQLDQLTIALLDEYPHIARMIQACRTESARAGSLRIVREKQARP